MPGVILADAWTATSEWFTTNKDFISGMASVAAVLGLVATAIALFRNADEARQQRKLDQARAIYEIQRDARAEASVLFKDEVVTSAFLGRPPDPIANASGSSLNFYASVYQMWRLDVLDDQLFEPFRSELVSLVAIEPVWASMERIRSNLDPGFVELADELRLAANVPSSADQGAATDLTKEHDQ